MTWLNTPGLTLGKLKTEERVCTKCWKKVIKAGLPKGAVSTKHVSYSEVLVILSKKEDDINSEPATQTTNQRCSCCKKESGAFKKHFGSDLKDGWVCGACSLKIGMIDSKISANLKQHSLSEITKLLDKGEAETHPICSTCNEGSGSFERHFGRNLLDGWVCKNCFKVVLKSDPKIATELEQHSLIEIQTLLKEKDEQDEPKKSKLAEIKAQIEELKLDNISTFFGRKEINELPSILAPTETVDNIIQGVYSGGQGILVSTDRRLVFVDKGMIYGLKVEDFPLDKISSIQYETGLLMAKVKIHTSGNVATIENVEKNSARSFSEFVRDKLSNPTAAEQSQTVPQTDVLDQLEKLGKLKAAGILSDEEFEEQKKKLLEKL
ncbi:MAG: hypothetical protein ACI9YU_001292 [Flavobacteriales bacterium]|jgi:hypothetical protein